MLNYELFYGVSMAIGNATTINSAVFRVGDQLGGRYQIEEIKRGNMGIVYLCVDQSTQQPVALKTFDSRYFCSDRCRLAFLKEASTWIQLERHPNIVQAYSLQQLDSQPYLLLERIQSPHYRGSTLKDLIFSEPLSVRRMIQIGVHICDGMIHALSKFPGLVHRDLKSENILAGSDGLPKISDFGMTLEKEPDPSAAGSGIPRNGTLDLTLMAHRMTGTPAFASPEQCLSLSLDTRSDIYSFGCILYHMAVKRMPFHRDSIEKTILAQMFEAPVPPQDLNGQIPRNYSDLILTCLEKRPENRFDSFSSLRQELIYLYEVLFGGKPVSLRAGLPLRVEDYVERAQSFAFIHQYVHAQSELHKALQANPRRADVFYHLSKISFQQRQFERALSESEKALTVMPHDPQLHLLRGRIYRALSRTGEAEQAYQQAIQLDPTQTATYTELVCLLIDRKDYLSAERVIRDALFYCGEEGSLYLLLAEVQEHKGKFHEQYQSLEKAAALLPKHVGCLLTLAELSSRFHRYSNALAWAFKALRATPRTFQEWHRLGRVFRQLNDLRLAAEAWSRAAALGQGDADFYLELATLYWNLREYDEAWTYALEAERLGADGHHLKAKIQSQRRHSRV